MIVHGYTSCRIQHQHTTWRHSSTNLPRSYPSHQCMQLQCANEYDSRLHSRSPPHPPRTMWTHAALAASCVISACVARASWIWYSNGNENLLTELLCDRKVVNTWNRAMNQQLMGYAFLANQTVASSCTPWQAPVVCKIRVIKQP